MNKRSGRFIKIFLLIALALAIANPMSAAAISLGYASFDFDNPVLGQNSISINNLSGPTFGCGIDFNICDNVSIVGASLLITYLDNASIQHTATRTLSSAVLPGTATPPNFIFDAATFHVIAAELTGTIAPLTFTLSDTSVFTALPSFDAILDIGNSNIGIIQLSDAAVAAVPEPTPFTLLLAPLLFLVRRRK